MSADNPFDDPELEDELALALRVWEGAIWNEDREESRRRIVAEQEKLYRLSAYRASLDSRSAGRWMGSAIKCLGACAELLGLTKNAALTDQQMTRLISQLHAVVEKYVTDPAKRELLKRELREAKWQVLHHDDDDSDADDIAEHG